MERILGVMRDIRSGTVDIIREFLVVHEMLTQLVASFDEGSLRFEQIQQLVGGDASSALFRLKERCHALFRPTSLAEPLEMRTGALLDLAVGSLFHEAMTLRENLYQQEYYAPRVNALRSEVGAEDELFSEFAKILGASAERLEETVNETRTLLAQTRRQLLRLMIELRDNALIARCLYEQEDLVAGLHPDGLSALFCEIYEDPVVGYTKAGESYLESGTFAEAQAVLGEALKLDPERRENARLMLYAEGMQAFLSRDYVRSVDRLRTWLSADPGPWSQEHLKLALSAMTHVDKLADDETPNAADSDARALAAEFAAMLDPAI